MKKRRKRTAIGFRLSTTKLSARPVMKRVNLWHRMRSMSSACLILIDSRMELTEGSIRTFSVSDRVMVRGVRRTSGDVLEDVDDERGRERGRL